MSTIAVKKVKLGDNVDTSKNFLIEVPAIADGTLTIKRENGGNVFEVNSSGAEVKSGNFVVGNGVVVAKSGASSPNTVSTCGYTFTTDPDSGMFNPVDGTVAIAGNGTPSMYVTGSKVTIAADYGSDWYACPLVVETRPGAPNNTSVGIAFHTPAATSAGIFKLYGPSSTFECRNSTDTAFLNIAAANFVVSSDYRLKENVVPLGESLPKLKLIKPSSYTRKDTGKSEDGFIAHELQEVIPQAVFGEKDKVLEDGTPVYQGVDASRIMPLVVKSLQELASKVEALEAELAAIKGQ